MTSTIFTLSVMLFLLTRTAIAQCSHSSHCSLSNPSMIGFCLHRHGLCLSLPHPSSRQDEPVEDMEFIPRTLSSLINETDALDFPPAEKIIMVETAKKVYEGFNPHRFLHENLLGINFTAALDKIKRSENMSNTDFYVRMEQTFQLMDDKHTVFALPDPFASSFATLGFGAKIFFDKDSDEPMKRRYVVTDLPDDIVPEGNPLGEGSEILTYNGAPVDEAVQTLGENSYASNKAAQIDYGTQLLSTRILIAEPIPLEASVEIGYVNSDGEQGVATLEWLFVEIKDTTTVETMVRHLKPGGSVPFRKLQHKTRDIQTPPRNGPVGAKLLSTNIRVVEEGRIPIPIDPAYEDLFQAEVLSTSNGPIGRFVLPSFASEATTGLVAEITRVLGLMPENGLIMDLRNNGGGYAEYVKVLAEMVSGTSPPLQPTSLRATQIMKDGLESLSSDPGATEEEDDADVLSAFIASVDTALKIGEPFSGPTNGFFGGILGIPNPVPRAYFGPVVTLVNGLAYSAGDLYAAIQVDLDLSLLVGVSDNVGAGGASTASYELLQEIFSSVLDPLPNGEANGYFTTAFARFYRSGKNAGAIVENFGVKPQVRYYPTLNDALKKDCDLYEFLGEKLQEIKKGEELEPLATPEDVVAVPSAEEIIV